MKTLSLFLAASLLALASCGHSQARLDADSNTTAHSTALPLCCADAQKLGKECASCKEG